MISDKLKLQIDFSSLIIPPNIFGGIINEYYIILEFVIIDKLYNIINLYTFCFLFFKRVKTN
jgi:hypothetical protein